MRRGNLSGGQRFWEAGGCLGACLLCRWMLLGALRWKGGAAASLRGGIPPAALPPPPFHKGGIGLQRMMLLGESGWALEALARFLMGAAWCFALEGSRGGFAAGRNPSGGFAATSLSQGRRWAPAGGAFGGKASAQGFCGHGAATRILAFFLLDSAAGFMYNKVSGICDRQVREDGP